MTSEQGSTSSSPTHSGPTVTAAVVASTLLLLRDEPTLRELVHDLDLDAVDRAIRCALPVLGHVQNVVPWRWLRGISWWVERRISPGFIAHYALRKYEVRTQVRQALRMGFRQVVLIGAGFDMLGLSLPPEATVFEVDHPVTQRIRRQALDAETQARLNFIAVDLTETPLQQALLRCPQFQPNARTVYVAEGLLMYLDADQVEQMLVGIGRQSNHARLVCTVLTPSSSGSIRIHSQHRIVDWIMRRIDEPFVWGASPSQLITLMARCGLRIEQSVSTQDVATRVLGPTAGREFHDPTGELVLVCSQSHDATIDAGTV